MANVTPIAGINVKANDDDGRRPLRADVVVFSPCYRNCVPISRASANPTLHRAFHSRPNSYFDSQWPPLRAAAAVAATTGVRTPIAFTNNNSAQCSAPPHTSQHHRSGVAFVSRVSSPSVVVAPISYDIPHPPASVPGRSQRIRARVASSPPWCVCVCSSTNSNNNNYNKPPPSTDWITVAGALLLLLRMRR